MRCQLARAAFDLFVPPICSHCKLGLASIAGLCNDCQLLLDQCHIPPEELPGQTLSGRKVLGLWYYRNGSPLRSLHRLAKYGENDRVAHWLGQRLGAHLRMLPQKRGDHSPFQWNDCLCVPMPSHPARVVDRGMDSTRWMGRGVADELDLMLAPDLLKRTRLDLSQSQIHGSDRTSNVTGAFTCAQQPASNVLLIDDIVTTGATLDAAASVLESRGHVVRIAAVGFRRELFSYTRYR